MCHQNNLRFYDDIAYDRQYKGLILDGFEGTLSPGIPRVHKQHVMQLACISYMCGWLCLLVDAHAKSRSV